MHLRQIRIVLIGTIVLAAISAHAQNPEKPQARKWCSAPAQECERAIRSLSSGRRYLGALLGEIEPGAGLRIVSIAENSPAHRGGLDTGDRLMVVNGKQLVRSNIKDFKRIMSEARDTGWLSFIVQRGGTLKRVEIRMEPYSKAQIDKIVTQHMADAHPQSATTPQH